jgi:hypothetical protein
MGRCGLDLSVSGIVWEGVDWIYLHQGRDQWQALVNTLMSLQVL